MNLSSMVALEQRYEKGLVQLVLKVFAKDLKPIEKEFLFLVGKTDSFSTTFYQRLLTRVDIQKLERLNILKQQKNGDIEFTFRAALMKYKESSLTEASLEFPSNLTLPPQVTACASVEDDQGCNVDLNAMVTLLNMAN